MKKDKKYFVILAVIQIFIALGAIPAGILFTIEPNGQLMGTTTAMLADSPFPDFLIPGLFLLIVNGFGNVLCAIISIKKSNLAGVAAMFLGSVMCIWIVSQVAWIGYNSFLQPLFFVIGFAEATLGYVIYKKL